jgi:hypothetical protein
LTLCSGWNRWYGIFLECSRQKQGVWYTLRMSPTKTRVMVYSSNVSDKNKRYGILLECLRQKQGLWYKNLDAYIITLVFCLLSFWNVFVLLVIFVVLDCNICAYGFSYCFDNFLCSVRKWRKYRRKSQVKQRHFKMIIGKKRGLWYTHRGSTTNTRAIIYTSEL